MSFFFLQKFPVSRCLEFTRCELSWGKKVKKYVTHIRVFFLMDLVFFLLVVGETKLYLFHVFLFFTFFTLRTESQQMVHSQLHLPLPNFVPSVTLLFQL